MPASIEEHVQQTRQLHALTRIPESMAMSSVNDEAHICRHSLIEGYGCRCAHGCVVTRNDDVHLQTLWALTEPARATPKLARDASTILNFRQCRKAGAAISESHRFRQLVPSTTDTGLISRRQDRGSGAARLSRSIVGLQSGTIYMPLVQSCRNAPSWPWLCDLSQIDVRVRRQGQHPKSDRAHTT